MYVIKKANEDGLLYRRGLRNVGTILPPEWSCPRQVKKFTPLVTPVRTSLFASVAWGLRCIAGVHIILMRMPTRAFMLEHPST